MEKEFIGSNPSHVKVVCSLAVFFFIYFFFTRVLFSQRCVLSGPSLRCNTTVGSTPSHGKNAIEVNLALQEEISLKKS